MALSKLYIKRLDLLTHGYIKENIKAMAVPQDVMELIKIWHSNDEVPQLVFNMILQSNDKTAFEVYLDKPHWNILDINKFTLSYDITQIILIAKNKIDASKFYDKEHLITFFEIDNPSASITKIKTVCFEVLGIGVLGY